MNRSIILRLRSQVPNDAEEMVTARNDNPSTKAIAESIVESANTEWIPVTYESCGHVVGPFFHGTRISFDIGELVVPGHLSNCHAGRVSNNVYFAALLEPAIWAAELAVALAGSDEPGRVYVVEPVGPFEDDPNVTNKKFPGNVTRSYRTCHALRVVDMVQSWVGHPPEMLQTMIDNLTRLRNQGLDIIED
jgi:rifampin ADP-ribosylating transferase